MTHRIFQLRAQGDDLVGVTERQFSFFGENQTAPTLLKELVAQAFLQQLDLAGQGLRRGVQLLGCAHHAAGLGHHPEIAQVLEIQPDAPM